MWIIFLLSFVFLFVCFFFVILCLVFCWFWGTGLTVSFALLFIVICLFYFIFFNLIYFYFLFLFFTFMDFLGLFFVSLTALGTSSLRLIVFPWGGARGPRFADWYRGVVSYTSDDLGGASGLVDMELIKWYRGNG